MVAGALFAGACSADNPNTPSMSFAAPQSQSPANGVTFNFNQQPITLAITNVVRTGSEPVSYNVEVSTATNFATKAFSRDGIAEGSNGTTNVQLPTLDGG